MHVHGVFLSFGLWYRCGDDGGVVCRRCFSRLQYVVLLLMVLLMVLLLVLPCLCR